MIGSLKGIVTYKKIPNLIIECNGIGHELEATVRVFDYAKINEELKVFTHLSIREDAHTLYAFITIDERNMFRELIKVNGIGPKSALVILSTLTLSDLERVAYQEDLSILVKVPGIGKKTAEKLIIELRDRLPKILPKREIDANMAHSEGLDNDIMLSDAIGALISLGYKEAEAKKMLDKVDKELYKNSETIIKAALKNKIK